MQRDAIAAQLDRLGARMGKTVTRNTDMLLVGANPGETKLARAKELGTPILSLIFFDYLELSCDHAGPRGLTSLDDDFITTLQLTMAVYTEECYGHWLATRSPHAWRAFDRARLATIRLLHLAWGPAVEEHEGDGEADLVRVDGAT